MMWYAVWVRTGQEEKVRQLCDKMIDRAGAYKECFLPKYEKYRKINGIPSIQKELLFPGYLFFISDSPEKLAQLLWRIPEATKLLGDDNGPIALYPHEVEFLQNYMNEEKVIEMSVGYIKGEKLVVTQGPFRDYQGKILKIDRHKRKAVLEIEFFGRITTVTVGLEVVKKI